MRVQEIEEGVRVLGERGGEDDDLREEREARGGGWGLSGPGSLDAQIGRWRKDCLGMR